MSESNGKRHGKAYGCWLNYGDYAAGAFTDEFEPFFSSIFLTARGGVVEAAASELRRAAWELYGIKAPASSEMPAGPHIALGVSRSSLETLGPEGFALSVSPDGSALNISGADENGVLYGVFELLRDIGCGRRLTEIATAQRRGAPLRIVEHWDNFSGDIERGYAGRSIFFRDNAFIRDTSRVRDYARLLSSVSVNAVCINNVNVHKLETYLLTDAYLYDAAKLARIFGAYGVKLFMSVNYASPIEIGGLPDADPLNPDVARWWAETAGRIYRSIPDFGGFVVKADSENQPGPFAYGRDHAQGANMLARALKPYGGLILWRCFVYDCRLDWRDRTVDRAKAAYDNFKPLDGRFDDNIVLQIKCGPMDFQVREPVSPLFGAMPKTNEAVEFQITQEYTGQQKHLCYLVPQWKEALDFDTRAGGENSTVAKAAGGSLFGSSKCSVAGVSNIGDDDNWCGHPLAQANLYGFGRLAWDMSLSGEAVAREWTMLTFGRDRRVLDTVVPILMESRDIYEAYTAPLGVGWMVTPGIHYGPDVDGYEYSPWGTCHYADLHGLGVDRTAASGTGFTAQYTAPVAALYENLETCPDDVLLFFHHVPYGHVLKSGKTVLQHIYDTHFDGAERAFRLPERWKALRGLIDDDMYETALERFYIQADSAAEWRDVVNTYFYRKTGVGDQLGRKIYP